ncbi:hypothetical protein [Edaphobacter modestus]|uniref:hypothetical protein n=1 Tax=Edaphobacter modestus TaxID=388466 RepID=UPI00102CCE68
MWRQAIHSGKENGFRNAQVTVLAPTGTIGYMMLLFTKRLSAAAADDPLTRT